MYSVNMAVARFLTSYAGIPSAVLLNHAPYGFSMGAKRFG
jgi:hypothetical protein